VILFSKSHGAPFCFPADQATGQVALLPSNVAGMAATLPFERSQARSFSKHHSRLEAHLCGSSLPRISKKRSGEGEAASSQER
jgi:hypothetical protein